MTRTDFENALDRYGGNFANWPSEIRAGAEALIANDQQAATHLAEMRRLEGLIGRIAEPVADDAAFIGKVVAGIDDAHGRDILVRPTSRLVAWASAATVASLAFGFAAGILLPQDFGDDTFAGLMFGGTSYETEVESTL